MPAHLEPITYVLRAGTAFHRHGDPAECSATITIDEDGTAHIRGFAGTVTRQTYTDIISTIKAAGHTTIRWWRRKNGRWVAHEA